MDDERVFHIGPIRPPSEARSLLIQVTRGCTWNRCRFCNLYRDTQFKAYSADSVKQDIDTIAAYAQEVRGFWRGGHWDLDGLNERLREFRDDGARQCFYMVAQWLIDGGENVFLQDINGNLGSVQERRQMLARIDQYLGLPESDRRAFQLLRRTLRAYDLDDMLALPEAQMEQLREAVAGESEERWDEKMNEYISRFI